MFVSDYQKIEIRGQRASAVPRGRRCDLVEGVIPVCRLNRGAGMWVPARYSIVMLSMRVRKTPNRAWYGPVPVLLGLCPRRVFR